MTTAISNDQDPPVLLPEQSEAIPTWRAAYSDRTSALMAAFCQLAYVPYKQNPPAVARAPKEERPSGREELKIILAAGNFRLEEIFNKDDAQAFLAVCDGQFAVLAFRGTASLNDWITDLNAIRVSLPGVPGVMVHRGFLSAFECCREEIEKAVDKYVPSTLGLYITGHSLGGALAQIASAVLERDNLAACYTFGSPRVGTLSFDRQVKCPHYRVINNWDLVPGVPLPFFWGYHHTGDPRLLTPGTKGQETLRRDRSVMSRLLIDMLALIIGLLPRKFLVINDHMIWNYRTQLEAIAQGQRKRGITSNTNK